MHAHTNGKNCCGGSGEPGAAKNDAVAADRPADAQIDNAATAGNPEKPFTDPVCGMQVGANPEKTVEHAGIAYHFCSMGCVAKFKTDPQKYLNPKPAAQQAAAPAMSLSSVSVITNALRLREPKAVA